MDKKFIVVTGVSRGLGLGLMEKLSTQSDAQVIGSVRSLKKTPHLEAPNIQFLECEISSEKSRNAFIKEVLKIFPRVDVLVNNAGVFLDDQDKADETALNGKLQTIRDSFEINTLAPFHFIQSLLPGMIERNFGRIVNVSSGMGQLSDMGGGYPSYRISKTALNSVTKFFASEVKGKNILINSICPGWVRTDMGGTNAERSIEQGIAGIYWAMNLKEGDVSGSFQRDGRSLSW